MASAVFGAIQISKYDAIKPKLVPFNAHENDNRISYPNRNAFSANRLSLCAGYQAKKKAPI